MINLGILGCGRVVQNRLVDVFKNEIKNINIISVCDLINDKANFVASQLNSKSETHYERLLNDNSINTILIATESGNHYMNAKEALLKGKHVIVEKPPTLVPEEVIELEKLAQKKQLMYAPIFQNRFNPAMKILKKTLDNGRFGKIVLATIRLRWCRYQEYYNDGWHGTWKMDGGVINQQAIHHVDALQWICGEVANVCSDQEKILNNLEAEDTTVAIIRFKNRSLGVIEATTAARPEDFEASISIVAEKGMVVIGGIALNKIDTWNFVEKKPEDQEIPLKYSQEVSTGYGLSHGPLLKEIFNRIDKNNIIPPITVNDVLPTINLVHAIYSSKEKNHWVNVKDNPLSSKLGK
ncbi:MAG: Gfo/Idh/MocA family oxidoreductase [Spirochaetes bacterium]|nr:Gfo/Idh/MocA family oxidoreductase [Spirochaetota bacterium]